MSVELLRWKKTTSLNSGTDVKATCSMSSEYNSGALAPKVPVKPSSGFFSGRDGHPRIFASGYTSLHSPTKSQCSVLAATTTSTGPSFSKALTSDWVMASGE
eukprot:CAMPEP_0198362404 /NCGR_PEP_ID=MMETSP1450-20131203/145921_1 /TAXON_ID=753684 ORGANISM="Madagascaria erythrocladiodes, Strain CCMP3234" /NCGR_SAMPLE_ID=MMETSP1450 /ASSEMBLY_ACC=CAM_ASM_001115 /LENGTH=101 /DNA_ID=CAMNT_0044069615 /DNA_START=284 /DNA_END=589 /DNA_ORIENTATION=+